MRVTNGMIVNTTLNGLYNNMNTINKTYAQMVTGKKIQTVSDDPIIAGRALKLKNSVLETSQYESNAKEANSWMEITEGALKNIYNIIENIRTKCVEASTGTLEKEDKEVIKNEIEELMKQLQGEANVTYGGRYVFSGYKTSEPLILTSATELQKDCVLKADLQLAGEMKIVEDATDPAHVKKTSIKSGSTLAKGSVLGKDIVLELGSSLAKGTVLSQVDTKALLGFELNRSVTDGKYQIVGGYTLKENTKLTADTAKQLAKDLGYTEDQFEQFAMDNLVKNEDGTYQVKQDIAIDQTVELTQSVAEEMLGVSLSGDTCELTKQHMIPAGQANKAYQFKGEVTLGEEMKIGADRLLGEGDILTKGSILLGGSTLISGTTLPSGTLNPLVNGHIKEQSIDYEIGVNSTISVNTLGMDGIFSELMRTINEISSTVDKSLEDETVTTAQLYQMFDQKLKELDEILGDVSQANTDLGSRMARVEYIETRLTDQKMTLKNLLTNTEDIDIEEVYVTFNIQYATYQSALQATSKIITNTLADYL